MPLPRRKLLGVLFCSVILAGCKHEGLNRTETTTAANGTASEISVWPALPPALPVDPALEARISGLMARMTIEEKVGQLIQAEIKYTTPEDVRKYHLGSVLNGGGTYPDNNKFATPQDWLALSAAFFAASMDTSDGGVAIPIIWGSDAVHGHNNIVGATLFPHNIGLGAARDPDLIRRIGVATAREVAVTGIGWTFAPTVAVVRDDRWGRTYESYSEDPAVVQAYAEAMVKGLQGEKSDSDFLRGEHLVATAKHFVGDGGTMRGIDRGDNQVSESELAKVHGAGYLGALPAGVQTVMASFNSWRGEPLHGHRYLLTDVLKGQLGFDGFVVGDWNGHRFVPGCTVDSCAAAINAGLDMFMVPSDWKTLYENTLAQARRGEIRPERLDDAVRRILRVKIRAGLFEHQRPLAGRSGVLGSAEHRAVAREAVRKSLVLLKNNNNLLPLSPAQSVLVAGDGAHNLSKQTGGWTISWQGTGNTREDFPGATTIFEGIQALVKAAGGEVVLSARGEFDSTTFTHGGRPDVAIVVFGEEPYAEWHGDLASLEYQLGSNSDLALLQALRKQGIPVVSIFLSGRPLWVNRELNASDAFVAAWLPGSEGAGVADVVFTSPEGGRPYGFSGTLPFSWPHYVHQTVLNPYHPDYAPLFPLGYGLQDGAQSLVSNTLTEDGDTYSDGALEDAWLMVSRPRAPWKLFIVEELQAPVAVTGNRSSSGPDTNITVAAIDRESQEDARQIRWKGLRPGAVWLAAERPQDLSHYLKERAALILDVRVDRKPEHPVRAGIACGPDCAAELPLQTALAKLQPGNWSTLSIDLQCFAAEGADFSRVSGALSISSEGALELAVADVKYVPGAADRAVISCGG
ncbi:exo 1,3/1,4-beta-D-glucan glucohydrolase [Microbulbifer sp. 2205BS26-8]|uniref:glycoside hydrolase family 3 protein n=1 Tax=Microbulbifer sp. 2205BS26-8 TaxID=3064386 RepID=UPI00273EEEC9|nr:glycoside hydrolase family 3 N-terminal domain-containing protein [Microbulbifer sp. 2205BS26-8]MDP5209896.1 glycoside hydrolase family 3 N-terminal domain-containing protein [Microbulbifer sp. 2205BS26-8]